MNKPHKHKDVIIAWANGELIQHDCHGDWVDWLIKESPSWEEDQNYRIKPEPKPDVVKYGQVYLVEDLQIIDNLRVKFFDFNYIQLGHHNIQLTFDGETGELWDTKVLK